MNKLMPEQSSLTPSSETPPNENDQFLMLVRSDVARSIAKPQSGNRNFVSSATKQLADVALEYASISPEVLQIQLNGFLAKMNKVVKDLPTMIGEFELDEVELSVEITAKGTVAFLGAGGEIGGTGGLKFNLKRK